MAVTFITPKRTQAACNLTPGSGGCAFTCSYNRNGNAQTTCCSDSQSCTQFRAAAAVSGGSSTAAQGGGSGTLRVDPSAGCSDGINTALGCIPYNTTGFTSALLTFLAGVVGLIAIVVMLVATIMIMTGGDNSEQVKKGKELFTGGITGLFFIIFSVTLLRIVAGDIIKLPGF